MSVNTRKLGNSGLEVRPLALGGNVFGWTVDEATSFRLLDGFVAAGFNLIDTADMYSRWVPGNQGGESETIIGNWFKRSGKRGDVVLATKLGYEMGPGEKGLSKRYILQAVERSLKRLQTDYIDLYQSHVDDASTPLEETLEAYGELIRQGKVRAIAPRIIRPIVSPRHSRSASRAATRATIAFSHCTTSMTAPRSRTGCNRFAGRPGLQSSLTTHSRAGS